MKVFNRILLFTTFSFLLNNKSIAQDETEIPFSKWEIGVNPIYLIDKSIDPIGFIVKRNYLKNYGRSSLRMKLLPRINYYPLVGSNQTIISYQTAIGYEWQHMVGKFSINYGIEVSFGHLKDKVYSDLMGTISEGKSTNFGISPFVGGRYYFNKHISMTIETHLFYNYVHTSYENDLASSYQKSHNLTILPLKALYLSYHF